MKNGTFSYLHLNSLFSTIPVHPIDHEDRIVIFSDLHVGNGRRTDDFRLNSRLFLTVLEEYYRKKEFTLVLNGDIEELQRFTLSDIKKSWPAFYSLLGRFRGQERLFRLIGNHDLELNSLHNHGLGKVLRGLHLSYRDKSIFIFHGHQTSKAFLHYHRLFTFLLRYVVNPLGIRNYSVSASSRKRYKTEKRVYEFSTRKKILSVIGHTHRPLFESMSKIDTLKFEIERLCRKYPKSKKKKKDRIEKKIDELKNELSRIREDDKRTGEQGSLYDANLVVPCVFNSGCVIGKRGITGIEIYKGRISLVHWFDRRRSRKYLRRRSAGLKADRLGSTNFFRVVIKEDYLDYIFARIKLLS